MKKYLDDLLVLDLYAISGRVKHTQVCEPLKIQPTSRMLLDDMACLPPQTNSKNQSDLFLVKVALSVT
jgi:hypothetical protein